MFTDQPASDRGEIFQSSLDRARQPAPKFLVRVCQNTSCTKEGAAAVLRAFQRHHFSDVKVVSSACLGCCGNGPMVLVLPDEVWYSHVAVENVEAIATQHLEAGQPVTALLDRTKHPEGILSADIAASEEPRSLFWVYGLLVLAVLVAIASIGWTIWLLT